MPKNCKTCLKAVNANEKSCTCVACNCNMHQLPNVQLFHQLRLLALKSLALNVMLLCNNCSEENDWDNSIRCRTPESSLDNVEKLEEFGKATNGLSG